MGARSEALARRFVAKPQEAVAVLEQLSEADWKRVTEAERYTVSVTVRHQNFLPECRSRRPSFDIMMEGHT
jgi:hypothetical protein